MMKQHFPLCVGILTLLFVLTSGRPGKTDGKTKEPADAARKQAKAIAAIKKMGGQTFVYKTKSGESLISVSLKLTQNTDAGLVHLKGLTNLGFLDLTNTKVTDVGLLHLKGLTSLRIIWLNGTKVTNAGIKRLEAALPKCFIEH